MKVVFRKILEINLCLFFFFLPSWRLLQNINLVICLILPPYNSFNTLFFLNKIKKSTILFFLYVVLNIFLNGHIYNDFYNIIKILPLLLIPIAFDKLDHSKITNYLVFFVLGILCIQIISVFGLVDYLFFFKGKKYELTNYGKLNDILGFERPYLGFFSSLSIMFSYYLFKKTKNLFFILVSVFSFFLNVYISARLSVIISLIFISYIIYNEINNRKYKFYIFTSIIIFILIFLNISNSSIKKRFLLINKDSRYIIWQGAWNQVKNNNSILFGNGSLNQIKNDLKIHYENYEFYENEDIKNRFIRKNYNIHNQFLNELIRSGIVGLFLLIFPILYLILENFKNKNLFNLSLLCSLILFLLVENLFERQKGVYIFATILSLVNKKLFKISN